jgi:riboflavin synthase
MFSGIIKSLGTVSEITNHGTTLQVSIISPLAESLSIDQSISHDGVCLTVVAVEGNAHRVDIIRETIAKTTLGAWTLGRLINLEQSITAATLLDGHLVQGHVDTTLLCLSKTDHVGSWNFKFALPTEYAPLVIPQGSICLNGVSLTIAHLDDESFEVAIIPYTYKHTNFQLLQPGDRVNVEFDLIGKYILRQRK